METRDQDKTVLRGALIGKSAGILSTLSGFPLICPMVCTWINFPHLQRERNVVPVYKDWSLVTVTKPAEDRRGMSDNELMAVLNMPRSDIVMD